MHILQLLFAVLLLLQAIDANLIEHIRDRRSPNIQNIRLAGNGATRYHGRVEIQGPNGTWGTLCDDGFGVNDSIVVCRMLGFNTNYHIAYQVAYFGGGSGPIWLDDLDCRGTEADLEHCTSNAWGIHNCGHNEDAGVACKFEVLNIRLAGTGSTSSRGRVEVAGLNGTWGTISQNNFESPDAIVICRMLGFNTGRAISYYYAYFGAGSGPVWLNNLQCRGSETHLDQCSSDFYDYSHYYDAGVACDFVVQNIRLVGRRGTHEGRVEILGPDGMWGTLAGSLDGNAATVICRMLGFETTGVVSVFQYSTFGQGSGLTYYFVNSGCTGRETSITECGTYNIIANYYTDHNYDIGLSCNKENDIRLVGGHSELEGRVEVYHNGVWGTVCNNGFDYREAEVICYMLGYDTRSSQLFTYNHYGSGTGAIWLNNLSCNGSESTLDECPSITWGTDSCNHNQDVGVDCHQSVRLYGGRYPSEGYVQIGNDWKTICGYNLDGNLARVVCQSLGFNTSYWVPTTYTLTGSVTTSTTTIRCPRGTESDLAECKQGTSIHCSSYYALYANCTGRLNARLVGGSHSGEGKLVIQNNLDYRSYRVCTDVWTDTVATLFCQLIPSNVKGNVYGRVIRNTAFDQQPGSFVFLSTHCNGGLPFCIFEVNSTESCPYTDIAMSCTHSEQAPQYNVRLVGGQAEIEGRVEIKYNNTWYTLCDSSWDNQDAMVVCRSLGYWFTSPTAYSDAWFGQGSVTSSLIYPYCNNNEPSILDCYASYMFGQSTCSHSDDAGVRCASVSLGRDKVRLAYGSTPSNGKLEVFYNGHWGGVCMKSWTQRNTDVVCRMMMYHSVSPSYYVFNGTSTTIHIGDLQCRGNETDIGLCKAFLDKRNCTNEVVGIDCSGGIHARLTGGNSTMGYAQIQVNGNWTQLCASGWNNEEATVFCRTLGFSVVVATTNVTINNGVSASEYHSIDCSGWEDHVDQCRRQIPPGNCGYATVNCLKCFYEYTSNTGRVTSPNYPSYYYPPNWSCLYIIRPHGPSRSGLYTLKFNGMYLGNEGDEVQVRGGFPGTTLYSWKGYMSASSNLSPIVAKEFSIHFHSDYSSENLGFQAQWAPSTLEDALTAGCMSSGWNIKINTTILRMLYPDVNPGDIYMNLRPCTGKVVDDGLQFLHAYSSCNTQKQMTSDEVIYTNQLIQPIIDPRYPSIVFKHKWRVETRCSMPITGDNTIYMQPTDGQAGSIIENGYHNLTGTTHGALLFHFYTDPAFHNEIKGNLNVPFGNELYVKVVYDSQESNMKMRVDTCTVFDQYSSSQKLLVIQDGCPTNPMVHLISTENHETRFSYQVFEFQDSSHLLGLNCNATFCNYYDNSHTCTLGCTTKRAIIPEQEYSTTFTREVHSGRMSLLMEAPNAVLSADVMDHHLHYGGKAQNDEDKSLARQ